MVTRNPNQFLQFLRDSWTVNAGGQTMQVSGLFPKATEKDVGMVVLCSRVAQQKGLEDASSIVELNEVVNEILDLADSDLGQS